MKATIDIARERIAALKDLGACYDRRDSLRLDLEVRGISAVQLDELRLLEEDLAEYERAQAEYQQGEIEAENAWLRAAEQGTADDYAFEQWEAERGLF